MLKRTTSSSSLQRFVPSPAPASAAVRGAVRTDASADRDADPPLPSGRFGTPPGPPPGATRGAPRLGSIAVPPEIRRRTPGAVNAAPEAVDVAERIRLALRKAQHKLLESRRKVQASVDVARAKILARR